MSAIEINLSKVDRHTTFELTKEMVVDKIENKKWIFHSKFNQRRDGIHKRILANSIRREMVQRGMATHIDDCPIPARVWHEKPYANFTDDCIGCKNLVKPESCFKQDWLGNGSSGYEEEGAIYCIGHKTNEEIHELLKSKVEF